VVEFILGMSLMFNIAFVTIWIIGIRISKKGQKELEKYLGRQLSNFEDWMYKA